jgi:signal transduction histidine kinase
VAGAHGGSVQAENRETVGARMTIQLPLAARMTKVEAAAGAVSQ